MFSVYYRTNFEVLYDDFPINYSLTFLIDLIIMSGWHSGEYELFNACSTLEINFFPICEIP